MRRSILAALCFALVSFGAARPGAAQTINEREGPLSFQNPVAPADEPLWEGRGEMSIWTAIYAGRLSAGDVTSLSPVVRGHYDFADDWGGHFVMPLTYFDVSTPTDPGTTLIRFANITLGAHKRFSHGATSGTIALDVAIPTGWVPDDIDPTEQDSIRLAFQTSAAAHGGRRLWLWTPERLSFVASGGVSHRLAEIVDIFADAAIASLIPVGDEGTDVDLFVEAAIGGAWVVPNLLRLGLQLQLAWLPTGAGDTLQTSLELFGRVWLDQLFLALGFTVNLDEPAGFAFDTMGIWGLHVGVGSRF